MAGEGRPPTTLMREAPQDVGGRAKPGHDSWGTLVAITVILARMGLVPGIYAAMDGRDYARP